MTEISSIVLFPDPDARAFLVHMSWFPYVNPFAPAWAQHESAVVPVDGLREDRAPGEALALVSERLAREVAGAAALLRAGDLGSAEEMAVYRGAALLALWDAYRDPIQKIIDTDGVEAPFLGDFVATYESLRLDLPVLRVPEPRHLLPLMYQWRRNVFHIARQIRGRSPSAVAARAAIFQASMGGDRCAYARGLYRSMESIPVLITGETGTGKDLAAQCIGWGQYIPLDEKGERFVIRHREAPHARNLSELSEEMFEGALFGHKRGSFTGAIADAPGFFALPAPHGSLFLDEIGELALHLQAKLLRPLQNREIVPIGEPRPRPIHGRHIFATNRDLEAMCVAGTFRGDLLERMNGVRIHMPPLRQMLAEDPRELEHFVRGFVAAQLHDDAEVELWTRRVVGHVVERMPGRPWSRNLRELKNFTERYLVTDGQMPEPKVIAPPTAATAPAVEAPRRADQEPAEPSPPESVCVPSSQLLGREAKKGRVRVDVLVGAYVTEAYLSNDLNLAETAKLTGLHRQTVRKLIDHTRLARRLARKRKDPKPDK